MSEISEILSLAQLDKHYKLIDYLTKHPNEEFTISQLDYFLSQGASIQRFPPEWLTYMEEGKCSNRNVEVYRKEPEKKAKTETTSNGSQQDNVSSSALAYREHQRQIVLLCRRPEVTTLAQLHQLLKKPSASVDTEDCVGLHTDQIIISPELIQQAQRSGIAYYFPDKFTQSDARALNREQNKKGGTIMEAGENMTDVAAGADRIQYLALPPGVYLESKYCTHRGISIREECGLPTVMEVGEELYLTLDDSNARRLQLLRERTILQPPLTVQHELINMAKDAPSPLEIRVEKSNYSVPQSDSSTGTFRAFKAFMMLKATHRGSCKLKLTVNGTEEIILMVVEDKPCEMPGLLVAREREPEDVYMDPKLFFPDFLLAPPSVLNMSYLSQLSNEEKHQEDDNADKMEAKPEKTSSSPSPLPVDVDRLYSALTNVPLPWWPNASPTASSLRDATYPPVESIAAAQGAMLAARSLKDSHRLAEARLRVAMEEEKRTKGAKRTRNFFNSGMWSVNRHMIHFGLDTLVPFKKPETSEE